jgi:hypothetical protein
VDGFEFIVVVVFVGVPSFFDEVFEVNGGRLADGSGGGVGEVGDETEDGERVAWGCLGGGEGLFGRFAGGGVGGEGLGEEVLELAGG